MTSFRIYNILNTKKYFSKTNDDVKTLNFVFDYNKEPERIKIGDVPINVCILGARVTVDEVNENNDVEILSNIYNENDPGNSLIIDAPYKFLLPFLNGKITIKKNSKNSEKVGFFPNINYNNETSISVVAREYITGESIMLKGVFTIYYIQLKKFDYRSFITNE
jgi:hypothetical protein